MSRYDNGAYSRMQFLAPVSHSTDVSVAQRLRRRWTSDLAVMGSIPGPGVIRHLGQLTLPSLRGR